MSARKTTRRKTAAKRRPAAKRAPTNKAPKTRTIAGHRYHRGPRARTKAQAQQFVAWYRRMDPKRHRARIQKLQRGGYQIWMNPAGCTSFYGGTPSGVPSKGTGQKVTWSTDPKARQRQLQHIIQGYERSLERDYAEHYR